VLKVNAKYAQKEPVLGGQSLTTSCGLVATDKSDSFEID
jgi:hypothetical protein